MTSDERRGSAGTAIAIVLIAGGVGAGALMVWLPEHARAIRVSNEQTASAFLKALASAEADYRANDRDGNGVNDFWTADVAGLYRYGLIDHGIAEADARPLVPLVPKPIPYHGYYFVAMEGDDSESPPEDLRQQTDKMSGKVHHRTKFAFCAYPAAFGDSGRSTYIVNEGNTIFTGHVDRGAILRWPSDDDMRNDWSKGD